jgi:2-haloacid dehalogenase
MGRYSETMRLPTRRAWLNLAAASAAAEVVLSGPLGRTAIMPRIKAVAFDGFTTFDPRPISVVAEALFPGSGVDLANAWRTRQFEYTWLRTLTGTYVDFWHVTDDALVFAAGLLKLHLTTDKRQRLMRTFLELRTWPDALPALKRLKASGVRMVLLSNFTESMLDAAVQSCGLRDIFEANLSTDRVRAYKPDPRAYRMALDALKLRREEIVFAAFGGWDATGAKAFGYRTFWVNRMNLPPEQLGVAADAIGATLHDLESFVKGLVR